METLAELVMSLEDAEQTVLRASREYDARDVRSRAYRTGNALRHCGIRTGVTVGVIDDGSANALFCLFGGSLLGARVHFNPPETVEGRVIAGPTEELDTYNLPAGGQYVGWGQPPSDPAWMHLERDVWSENPAFPEPSFSPSTELFLGMTHDEVLTAAESIAKTLTVSDSVALRAPLSKPGTIVAGVVAPMIAGSMILLPQNKSRGTVAVNTSHSPEQRTIDPDEIEL